MRRMYTKNQLSQAVADFLANNPSDVAEAIGYAGTVSEDIGVKPIYQHSIQLLLSSKYLRLTCTVLTGSTTKFTWDTFKAYMIANVDESHFLKIQVSGGWTDSSALVSASYLYGSESESSVGVVGAMVSNASKSLALTNESVVLEDYVVRIN